MSFNESQAHTFMQAIQEQYPHLELEVIPLAARDRDGNIVEGAPSTCAYIRVDHGGHYTGISIWDHEQFTRLMGWAVQFADLLYSVYHKEGKPVKVPLQCTSCHAPTNGAYKHDSSIYCSYCYRCQFD